MTIKLSNALPEPNLMVRLRTYETLNQASRTLYIWQREEVFYADYHTVVVKVPELTHLDLSLGNRVVVFEVTLNGVDWT